MRYKVNFFWNYQLFQASHHRPMPQQQRHHVSPKGHMKYPSVTPWKLLKDTIDPETGYPYIRVRGDCPKRPDLSIHLPPKDDPRHNWRIRLVEDLVLPNIVVGVLCRV